MAKEVKMFQSKGGGTFGTLYDALKDELREYFADAIGNDAIAKKLIDHIGGDMPGFANTVRDMEKARAEGEAALQKAKDDEADAAQYDMVAVPYIGYGDARELHPVSSDWAGQ